VFFFSLLSVCVCKCVCMFFLRLVVVFFRTSFLWVCLCVSVCVFSCICSSVYYYLTYDCFMAPSTPMGKCGFSFFLFGFSSSVCCCCCFCPCLLSFLPFHYLLMLMLLLLLTKICDTSFLIFTFFATVPMIKSHLHGSIIDSSPSSSSSFCFFLLTRVLNPYLFFSQISHKMPELLASVYT